MQRKPSHTRSSVLSKQLKKLVATSCIFLMAQFSALSSDAAEVHASNRSFQSLDNVIGNWLKRPDLHNSVIGIEVMELPSGRILYSLNGNKRFVSASTCKVITTACAYDAFGANFKYSTKLYGTGSETARKVTGNIVLQPSQDPTLTRDEVRQMFGALAQKGLNQVDGSLYIGTVPGGFDHWVTGWLTEDWGQEWMPASSNLAIDKNIAQGNVVLKAYKNVALGPDTANNALSQALLLAGESAAWVEANPASNILNFYRSPGMSMGAPLVVANPTPFNEGIAATTAAEANIHFSNHSSKDKTFYPIVDHQSKPLSLIIQTCLHKSDNFYAQQLLRTLGLANTDPLPDAITRDYRDQVQVQPSALEARGLARITAWLGKIGVSSSEFVVFDGCGLSRKDGISPHTLNTVFKHMAGPLVNGPYLQLLTRRGSGSKGAAWFAFKTGSMDTARSVSGVIETLGGQHCAVTVMVNGHRESVSALRGEIDSLVETLETIESIKIESPQAMTTPSVKGAATKGSTAAVGISSGSTGGAIGADAVKTEPALQDGAQSTGTVTMVQLGRSGGGGGGARGSRTPARTTHHRRH